MSQWTKVGGPLMGGAAFIAALGFAGCSDDNTGHSSSGGASGAGGHSLGGAQAGGTAGTSPIGGETTGGGTTGGSASGGSTVGGSATGGARSGSSGEAGSGPAGRGGAPDGGAAGADQAGAGAGGSADPVFASLSPLPAVPPDPTNRYADNAAAAALGQRLFFDPVFSGPLKLDTDLGTAGQAGRVSCASCHSSAYLADGRSNPATVSIGTDIHTRNSPTLINSSFYSWTNWGGRFAAQWELPLAVAENPLTMNGNRLQLAHRIFSAYKADYEAVFGSLTPEIGSDLTRFPASGKPKPAATTAVPNPPDGPWEGMTAADRTIINTILANYSKAMAAYLRLLVSRNAPFDAWVAGDSTAISPAAQRGAYLFVGKGKCVSCHSGPTFSDNDFHALGVPQTGTNVPATDDGRFKDVPPLLASIFNVNGAFSDKTDTGKLAGLTNPMPDSAKGQFRTAGLRGVALTAPYMHSGQLATLEAVIDFYDAGGGASAVGLSSLGLTAQEKAELIAFLGTLTGDSVPGTLLANTAAAP
jgi:cytochrome c peroxidase